MPVYHAKVSGIAPVADTTLVRSNDWNDNHVVVVDLATEVSGILDGANGGTGSQYFSVIGLSAPRDYTFPDADSIMVSTDASQSLTNKTINAALNSISNLDTTMFAANVIDTDPTLAANSNLRIPTQAAAKAYVDNLITGLKWKQSVLVRTTGNITLSGEQTIDGVLTSASRVLVANQSTATQNGIYISSAGAWSRSTDADTGAELVNATMLVEQGSTYADTQWTCTNNSITIGVTNITFAQVSGAGTYTADGTTITLSGNQFSISTGYIGQTSITTLGTITTGVWNGTDIAFANIAQLAALSVLGNSTNALADMAAITAASDFQVLRRSGTAIGFGAINLASSSAVSGVLAEANGGTNQSTYTLGDILYASAANTLAKLPGSTSLGIRFLSQTGTGLNSAAPVWTTVALNGAGVSGTLPVDMGGTNQTSYTDGQLLIGNSTGNTLTKATLTGTANRLTVTNGSGSITLNVPVGTSGNLIPVLDGTNTWSNPQTITNATSTILLDTSRTFTTRLTSVATINSQATLNWSSAGLGVIHSEADFRVIDTARTINTGGNEHIHVINASYTGALAVVAQNLTLVGEAGLFLMGDSRTYDRNGVNQNSDMVSAFFGPSTLQPTMNNAVTGGTGRTLNYLGGTIKSGGVALNPIMAGDTTDIMNFGGVGFDFNPTNSPTLTSGTLNSVIWGVRCRQAVMSSVGNSAYNAFFNAISGSDRPFCLANNSAIDNYFGYDGSKNYRGTATNTTSSGTPATAMVTGDVYDTYDSTNWLFEHEIVASGAATKFNSLLGDVDFVVGGDTDANLLYGNAGTDRIGIGTAAPTKKLGINGDASLETAGNGFFIKEGTNATMGVATLVGGTVVVNTTKVTANSRIFLTAQALGTVTVGQGLAVSARTAGTSFTILSQSALDTSTVAWVILEPA